MVFLWLRKQKHYQHPFAGFEWATLSWGDIPCCISIISSDSYLKSTLQSRCCDFERENIQQEQTEIRQDNVTCKALLERVKNVASELETRCGR